MTISTPTVPGQILTSAYVNDNINSGLVYVASTTASGAQTVVLTGAFNSTYDSYLLVYNGLVVNTNTVDLTLSLGSSVTNYQYAGLYNRYVASTLQPIASSSATAWIIGTSGSATDVLSGSIEITNPFKAAATQYRTASYSATWAYLVGGYQADATSYTACTLKIGTGTLSTGTVTCYGYRKA
jgi:hypothetical protein